mmetsp:Transcript_16285/g.40320  ORF Transcript_16285/g.40320 Transcript_16285/m.40320 type:complete len:288 (+) Transcript_16285:36-899(+)
MDISARSPPQAAQPDTRLRYLRPLTLPAAPPAAPARDFPMRRPGERTQGRQALGWAPRSGRSRGERDVGLRGARAIRQREPQGGPRGGGVLSGHRPLGSVRVPWRLRGREHARAGGRGAAREHVRVVVQLAVRLRRQRLLQLRRMMRRQGQLRGLRRLGLRLRLRLWRRQLRAHRAGAAPLRAAQAARVAQRQAAAPLWRLSRAASDALPVARALQVRRGECALLALELAPGPAAPLRPAALIAAQAVIARERVIRRGGQRLEAAEIVVSLGRLVEVGRRLVLRGGV